MNSASAQIRRCWLVPEVVQTSAMDCGPATLKCLLEGFGVRVSYGRLREACQTDVDGTSIDTLEEIAGQLGLDAEQTLLPSDHLLVPEAGALPAIVVVRLANGLTHFVVAWRRHGPWLQVMDPSSGRRWKSVRAFLEEVYIHEFPISGAYWRQWAAGSEFLDPLQKRLAQLRVPGSTASGLIQSALQDESWRALGALDAATRMVAALVESGGLDRGTEAARVVESFLKRVLEAGTNGASVIPEAFWSVRPAPDAAGGEDQVMLRGAVLVRVLGPKARVPVEAELEARSKEIGGEPRSFAGEDSRDSFAKSLEVANDDPSKARADPSGAKPSGAEPRLSPELVAALSEPRTHPARELFQLVRADGWRTPLALVAAFSLAAGTVLLEAVVLRGLIEISRDLALWSARLWAMAAIGGLALALLLLEASIVTTVLRLGRRLETRLRVAFLEKLPRLVDRYFQSRLSSDMAERGHAVHTVRSLPDIAGRFLRLSLELVFTAAGIAWLDPRSAPVALLAVGAAIGLPLLTNPLLAERDLRVRTHVGALARFYLDALLGLVAVRTHGAERAIRAEHESLLAEWTRAGFGLQRTAVSVEGMQALVGFGFAVWLLFGYLARTADAGGVLLLVYWALNLPVLGQELAQLARQYPALRSVTLRLLEPLGAPEEPGSSRNEESRSTKTELANPKIEVDQGSPKSPSPSGSGASIALQHVTVRAGGHNILEDVNVEISAGAHVAIVGRSGAGKSSLVGLLLGWHRPSTGEVNVDGLALDSVRLEQLRRHTAWVDPAVQLWNRSLLDNLCYGADGRGALPIGWAVQQADLLRILPKLPDGLQSNLGENGGLVSGGEGQRVRFGRALLRPDARLVILDEPFRGLDREQRGLLLQRARQHWEHATLLCVTHDVSETQTFDRVLVIERGRLVEDARPQRLVAQPDSRYSAMLAAEKEVRENVWSGEAWRRLRLEDGELVEQA